MFPPCCQSILSNWTIQNLRTIERAVSLQLDFTCCGVWSHPWKARGKGNTLVHQLYIMNLGPKHIIQQTLVSLSHRISAKKTLVEVGQFASLEGIGQVFNTRPWPILTLQVFSPVEIYWTDKYSVCISGCYLSPSWMCFKWVEGPTVSPHMVLLDMFWCSWILVDFDSNSVHDSIKQISWSDLVKLFHFLSPPLALSSPVFLMILMIPENWWKWTSLLWILSGAAMSVRITCNKKGHGCRKAAKEKPLPLHSREAKGVYLPATKGDHIPATTARVDAKIPSVLGVIFGLCMCLTQAA